MSVMRTYPPRRTRRDNSDAIRSNDLRGGRRLRHERRAVVVSESFVERFGLFTTRCTQFIIFTTRRDDGLHTDAIFCEGDALDDEPQELCTAPTRSKADSSYRRKLNEKNGAT